MTNRDHEFSDGAARQALEALGRLCLPGTNVVLVGGAALILGYGVARTTHDIDVLVATPRLAEFGRAIEQVAEQLDLATRWINDGAKAYGEVLPDDFGDRLTDIGRFGHLSVAAVSRRDLCCQLRPSTGRSRDVDASADVRDRIVRACCRASPVRPGVRIADISRPQWPEPQGGLRRGSRSTLPNAPMPKVTHRPFVRRVGAAAATCCRRSGASRWRFRRGAVG